LFLELKAKRNWSDFLAKMKVDFWPTRWWQRTALEERWRDAEQRWDAGGE